MRKQQEHSGEDLLLNDGVRARGLGEEGVKWSQGKQAQPW